MSHTALLVIDAQRAFEHDPEWQEPATSHWLDQQNRLIDGARSRGRPITAVLHHSRYHFDPEGEGVEPVNGLTLPADTPRFIKHAHTAFSATGLPDWLQSHRISHVIISGIRTEQCCETTARAARDAGYDVDFPLDATLTFSMPSHAGDTVSADAIKAQTATALHRRFATVSTVDDLLERSPLATLNQHCPRSGARVDPDSVTNYRGHTVGFCNPGCRDGFRSDPNACVADRRHFDRLIALQSGAL